ncbi:hypothetical protein [Halorussus salinus]|uniref:hypothetical protein n=1 Tax=Halorussus salinus TaxID=1364935 RepID=UPI001092325D|nr:hypothetical protein [Halorussus salinus]
MSGLLGDRGAGSRDAGPFGSALAEIRGDRRARWAALVGGAAVGLAAAWLHWYGFLLGGALVGLSSKDLKRALAAGVGFGLLAWAVFAGLVAANGGLVRYAEMGRLLYLSVGIPVGLSTLGSLLRGAV